MENVTNHSSNDESQNNHKEELNIKPKNEVATINHGGLASVNLFDERQLVAAENFLTKVMRSEKGGIKSVNDGLAILMRAQDLNLPFSTCLEHIHVINGKTGVDVHVIKALLLKAGCTWQVTKNYQPLYEYTDSINVFNDGNLPSYAVRCNSKAEAFKRAEQDDNSDDFIYLYPVRFYKDFNNNVYREYQINGDKFAVVHNVAQAKVVQSNGKVPIFQIAAVPIDFITEYKITRIMPDGRVMEGIGSFTRSEAYAAGLFEKDTYVKYARVLIGHRAFTYAAREVASDYLMGVMETTELKVVADLPIDEQDSVVIEDIK